MEPFNINIIWLEFCTYHPQSRIDEHKHSFFHYLYVTNGEGIIEIGKNSFNLKKDRIYLISPQTPHSFQNTGKDVLSTIEIKFELNDKTLMDKALQFPPYINLKNTPVKDILAVIHQELAHKYAFFNDITDIKFMEFFTYIMRFASRQKTKKAIPGSHNHFYESSDEITKVINYIYSNIENELTLEALSNVVCLEKTYFLKKFKHSTGYTPMQFIRNVRIEHAKELLRFSDMNITQVAMASGFLSIHHFSSLFTIITGTTPSQYRLSFREEDK